MLYLEFVASRNFINFGYHVGQLRLSLRVCAWFVRLFPPYWS